MKSLALLSQPIRSRAKQTTVTCSGVFSYRQLTRDLIAPFPRNFSQSSSLGLFFKELNCKTLLRFLEAKNKNIARMYYPFTLRVNYRRVLTFESVNDILWCYDSNETSLTEISQLELLAKYDITSLPHSTHVYQKQNVKIKMFRKF